MNRVSALVLALLWLAPASAQSVPEITPTAPSGALTLVTGGTAQNLFGAHEVSRGCTITNPSTATETAWVNFYTTAVGAEGNTSIPLPPGVSIGCGGPIATAVSWVAATTGHKINASRW
jgi:hypothetical protein